MSIIFLNGYRIEWLLQYAFRSDIFYFEFPPVHRTVTAVLCCCLAILSRIAIEPYGTICRNDAIAVSSTLGLGQRRVLN